MRLFNKLSEKFNNIVKKYKHATPKQLVMAGVFSLAFAGAIAGGFASQQSSSAMPAGQSYRDCKYNAIDHNNVAGGCGALTPSEFCSDLWTQVPGDLQAVYAHFGMPVSDCNNSRFQNEARHGIINKSGQVIVDDEVVMDDAWTMGRTSLGGAQGRYPYTIPGAPGPYYHSHPSVSFGSEYLDVMVLFTSDGSEVQFAVMESCGNPITRGNKVKSTAKCNDLISHKTGKNKYQFTTDASTTGKATLLKFEYYLNGELFDTTTSASAKTKEITITKDSKVKVVVKYNLPGSRGTIRSIDVKDCETDLKFEEEEKFVYACDDLYATTKDNITFRFNVKASHSNNVKLISADFTLDGDTTTSGVTNKNDKDEIYKDYTFNDEKSHTVTAVVNFEYTKDGQTKKVRSTELCKEKVTPKQKPVCEYNPNLPPEHPDCKKPECKPGIPEGDDRCKECVPEGKEDANCELPKTGPAGVAGLFASVAAAGTLGHRMFMSRRNR